MMNRKLIFIIFCLIIASFLMGSAPHEDILQDPPLQESLNRNRAVIVNENTGELYVLPVVKDSVKDLGDGKIETQYYVEIPKAIFHGNNPSHSASKQASPTYLGRYDPTMSVIIHVSKTTGCSYFNNQQYEKTYSVIGAWVQEDDSVYCSLLIPAAFCNGPFYGGGNCNSYDPMYLYYPPSSVWYSNPTSWSSQWVLVNYIGYYQAASTKAYLVHGTHTYSFTVQVSNNCLP